MYICICICIYNTYIYIYIHVVKKTENLLSWLLPIQSQSNHARPLPILYNIYLSIYLSIYIYIYNIYIYIYMYLLGSSYHLTSVGFKHSVCHL